MRKNGLGLVVLALVLGAVSTAARADELADLKQMILEQSQQLQRLQAKLAQIEAKQESQEEMVEQRLTEVQVGELPDNLKWIQNVQFSGDFRYRHERIEEEVNGEDEKGRDRNRIRARLMALWKVNEDWDVGIRLAAGSEQDDGNGDPRSTNQTLTDAFSSKNVWLDLAYAHWHPSQWPNMNLMMGKFKNPFIRVGKNELLFDGDLNPEGVAGSYKIDYIEDWPLLLTAGGMWVAERGDDDDTFLWGIQGAVMHDFEDFNVKTTSGVSYYDVGGIKGENLIDGDAFGNSTATNANGTQLFADDYDLLEFFAELGTDYQGMPISVFASWVNNTAGVHDDEDTGYLVGLRVNKTKNPGDWAFLYNFRDVDPDSVVGVMTDSDFNDGDTGGTGHEFGLKYQIAKNFQAGLTWFHNERTPNDDEYQRLQIDFIYKF